MLFNIPPRNPPGRTLTAYWENFLTEEDITNLLSQPEWDNTSEGTILTKDYIAGVDHKVRITDLGWLFPNPETADIWVKISNVVAEVNRQFYQFDLTGIYEPMQLGIYTAEREAHYSWHTDAGLADGGVPRKLSLALCLTDPSEFEGGELQIRNGVGEEETLELKKGRMWFFPSFVLHRVTPVTKGVRKSAVLWVGGPAFK